VTPLADGLVIYDELAYSGLSAREWLYTDEAEHWLRTNHNWTGDTIAQITCDFSVAYHGVHRPRWCAEAGWSSIQHGVHDPDADPTRA
jgi:hypothetical protein